MIPRGGLRLAAGLVAAALVVVALAPRSALPEQVPHSFGHVIAFALLAGLCEAGELAPRGIVGKLLMWVAVAGGIELAQGLFTTDRSSSVIDALGSLIGAAAGSFAGRLRHPMALLAAAGATIAIATATPATMDALRERVGDWPARPLQR